MGSGVRILSCEEVQILERNSEYTINDLKIRQVNAH
jgi:hypothetical protein